jgi:hypothetical protein
MYKYRLEMVDTTNLSLFYHRITYIHYEALEQKYVSDEVISYSHILLNNFIEFLELGKKEARRILSIETANEICDDYDNQFKICLNRIEQLEYIHKTGRPEMGMDWETYEMNKLHENQKLKFEQFLDKL